ncbi:MAG: HD domain-containing protein [Sporomusaceae bacterium]|nr:HD domain-containing protein [Sporomusaceae bacterium]
MRQFQIPIFQLITSLAKTVDLINPLLSNHHNRVAYIAYQLAKEFGFSIRDREQILLAGLLHDVGAVSLPGRMELLHFDTVNIGLHCELGYRLLKKFTPFQGIANIIRFHHMSWEEDKKNTNQSEIIPLASHILHLADRISVLVEDEKEIFHQVPEIIKKIEQHTNIMFHPQIVECFKTICHKEEFWLDIICNREVHYIDSMVPFETLLLNIEELLSLADVLAKIIDYRSPFTASHSSGVSAVAEAIASLLPFSKQECLIMRVAGLLHDLGKVAIPIEILEKKSSLSEAEWNIMRRHTYYGYHILQPIKDLQVVNEWGSLHHERIDGKGYPFHLTGDEISLGSRVMAVADVFTAITEDRPYRRGMDDQDVIKIMKNQANNGVLDSKIVSILLKNFNDIQDVLRQRIEQSKQQYQCFVVD